MRDELQGAKKVAAIGDMTAFYLLKSSIVPDLAVVDNKTKRAQLPDHILQSLEHNSYKRVEVKNPPATLTEELIDQIKDSLAGKERVKIVVEGEEDLAVLACILYAPVGSWVVYGQPGEGMVLIEVDEDLPERIKELWNRMEELP
jgi:uncharacterized protein (UPF0218 family)